MTKLPKAKGDDLLLVIDFGIQKPLDILKHKTGKKTIMSLKCNTDLTQTSLN